MNLLQQPLVELESSIVARFQDCDPFGHLNNARYIDYFLNARQDQLIEHYNFRAYQPEMQASWVIRKTQIAYLRPVAVMEEVLIRTHLLDFSKTSLVVEGLMLDKRATRLKSLVWFDFVYVSLVNGRPADHPDELMRLFESVLVPENYHPNGFNRRVEAARRIQQEKQTAANTQ